MSRVMNFFWSGDRMSWLRAMSIVSFVKFNPDWVTNLYIDSYRKHDTYVWHDAALQDFVEYRGKDFTSLIPATVNPIPWKMDFSKDLNHIAPSQRSNLFKYQLMARGGGYYSDMDILYLKSLNPIESIAQSFNIGITQTDHYSIGFLFAQKQSPVFQNILNHCEGASLEQYQGFGVNAIRQLYPSIRPMAQVDSVLNIPESWFYLNSYLYLSRIYMEDDFLPLLRNSFGIHWYAAHTLSQQYNNQLTQENYRNQRCTLSSVLEYILDQTPTPRPSPLGEAYRMYGGRSDKGSRHSYIPFYESLFAPLREKPIQLLEIGTGGGDCLKVWKNYFPQGRITGLDFYKFQEIEGVRQIQGDATSYRLAQKEFNGQTFDIIIDDGSHRPEDYLKTFMTYAPYLSSQGVYVIEDIPNQPAAKFLETLGFLIVDRSLTTGIKDDVLAVWHVCNRR